MTQKGGENNFVKINNKKQKKVKKNMYSDRFLGFYLEFTIILLNYIVQLTIMNYCKLNTINIATIIYYRYLREKKNIVEK